MIYTVSELITRAFYLSGKVAQGFETVTGDDLTTGLFLLNALLDTKSADQRHIPYFKETIFSAIIGQQEYFVEDLLMVESATFNISEVRYSMDLVARRDYFGSGRVDNITSLPYQYHVERTKGGSNIFLYFLPEQNYPIKIWGKFSLADVSLNQDLALTLDLYYIEYLRYALAQYIADENGIILKPQLQKRLAEFEKLIIDISPIDFSMSKYSILQSSDGGLNWADINLGKGWSAG